jgi:hypothetical protein
MKIAYISIFFISVNIFSDDGQILVGCDEKISLTINELTMTDEEIVIAKDKYFNKLLAQLNGNCISSIVGSSQINSSSLSKGGKITSQSLPGNKKVASISSNISSPKINNTKEFVKNSPRQETLLKCLSKYKNDDEFSMQLKEAISKTNDPNLKKDLIERFAKYNNLKPESIKC